jgi:hypothetical protein
MDSGQGSRGPAAEGLPTNASVLAVRKHLASRMREAGTTIREANVFSRETNSWRAWEATEMERDFSEKKISRIEPLNLRRLKPLGDQRITFQVLEERGRSPAAAAQTPPASPPRPAGQTCQPAPPSLSPRSEARGESWREGLPSSANPPLSNGPILRFMEKASVILTSPDIIFLSPVAIGQQTSLTLPKVCCLIPGKFGATQNHDFSS